MRKVVLVADVFAVIALALWFGSYRWWMFYGCLVFIIIIETSCRYLKALEDQGEP